MGKENENNKNGQEIPVTEPDIQDIHNPDESLLKKFGRWGLKVLKVLGCVGLGVGLDRLLFGGRNDDSSAETNSTETTTTEE